MSRGAAWRAALAVAVAAVLGGCVPNLTSPARTDGAYREKAARTAGAGASSAATSELLATAAIDDGAFGPYLSVAIGDAERDLDDVSGTFSSILPPTRRSQDLRDRLVTVLDRTADDVAEARIAIRHGERAPLHDVRGRLQDDADQLSAFEEQLS